MSGDGIFWECRDCRGDFGEDHGAFYDGEFYCATCRPDDPDDPNDDEALDEEAP